MSIKPLFYTINILCIFAAMPCVYAQHGKDTTGMAAAAKQSGTDDLYFDAMKAKMHDDDKKAIELLEEFVAKRPNVAGAYYELAKLTDKTKAEDYIKKALKLSPDNKWYKEHYAAILADRGAYDEAATLMAELVAAYPRDKKYPLKTAEYYEKAKKYEEAITYIDKAMLRYGQDEDLLISKIQLYLAMNKLDKATEVVQQLITQEPRNGRYYKLLGDLYDNNKHPEKAAEVYERAKKIIPNDPAVQLGIAEHYLKKGDTAAYMTNVRIAIRNKEMDIEGQIETFQEYMRTLPNDSVVKREGLPIVEELVQQHPDDPKVQAMYGDFLEANDRHDSAVVAYKRSLQVKSDFQVWKSLLNAFSERQYADSLIKYSEKFMRLYPTQMEPHFYNAVGHYNKKQYPAAIKAMNRAIDIVPENNKPALSALLSRLAEMYHENKQDDLSDKTFDRALAMEPDNASVLNNYSYYLSERGMKLDEAERMSKRSLDLDPDQATFLDTYGWIQYKKGSYLKAKEYVERAIMKAGGKADATLFNHLGDIYFKLNQKDNALENWKKAKEKGSEDPLINKKISEGKLYE